MKGARFLQPFFINTVIQKSMVAIIIGARAHRKLSSGVIDPAKINLFDLSMKAMDTII